jgi:hypothetical protein
MPEASHRTAVRALFAVTATLFVLRLGWILREPDLDGDAYGHFGIGCTLAGGPWNLAAHWVWLPLYHYLLAGFVWLRLPFAAVRIIADVCSLAVPWALFHLVHRHGGDAVVARDAAIACALSSSANMLGVSAQQEALFVLVVLLAASAIDARRSLAAGLLLATACLIRYEAWGAAAVVAAQGVVLRVAPPRVRARLGAFGDPLSPAVFVPPALAIAGWILVHRVVEGEWLGFLRELYTFTHMQRAAFSRGAFFDAVWFPVVIPLLMFGPAVLLVPLGVRGALSRGWIVPLAIYAFLLSSYAGGGSLGGSRYYGSLVPFFCAAMAYGVRALPPRLSPRLARAVLWGSLGISAAGSFVKLEGDANARREGLRVMERELDARARGVVGGPDVTPAR